MCRWRAGYGYSGGAVMNYSMAGQFMKLFEPGSIGKLKLRNRIVLAPIATNLAGPDALYTQRQIDYYAERARGGKR